MEYSEWYNKDTLTKRLMTKSQRVWVDLVSRSKIILGCMSYGESWVDWSLPEEEAIKQIKAAYELGTNVSPMCSSGTVMSTILILHASPGI